MIKNGVSDRSLVISRERVCCQKFLRHIENSDSMRKAAKDYSLLICRPFDVRRVVARIRKLIRLAARRANHPDGLRRIFSRLRSGSRQHESNPAPVRRPAGRATLICRDRLSRLQPLGSLPRPHYPQLIALLIASAGIARKDHSIAVGADTEPTGAYIRKSGQRPQRRSDRIRQSEFINDGFARAFVFTDADDGNRFQVFVPAWMK